MILNILDKVLTKITPARFIVVPIGLQQQDQNTYMETEM